MKHLKLFTTLLTLTVMVVGIQTAVFAASQLEEAAIKEGKVIWYGAWPKKLMDKVAKAFEAKYPKIDVMVFRSGSSKVAAKFAAEKEAGAVLCDVFTVSDLSIYLDFKDKGYLEKYTPEEFNKFGEQFRDPDGYWVTPRVYVVGIWYNVENLKKAGLEPPPSWRSLTDPKYKDRITLGSPLYSGTSVATVGYFVNEKGWGWDYWKQVLANNPLLIADTPDIARTVSTGQRDIGPCIWGYISMFPPHPKGTIDVSIPEEGVLSIQSSSALVKDRPHSNAGKFFQKYLMGRETAEIITGDFYYSGRTDVPPASGKTSLFDMKTFGVDRVWLKNNKRDIQNTWTQISGEKKKKKK